MMGAAFGLGFVLGPAVGGLFGAIDPRWPFWGAAATSLLNACYGFFVLPESLALEKRSSLLAGDEPIRSGHLCCSGHTMNSLGSRRRTF